MSTDVLVFSAHPDDAEMAMGGTLIKLSQSLSVTHVCLTKGDKGTYGDPETRTAEFHEACRLVGCRGMMLDFPDTEVENNAENRKRLARIIREERPRIVFCPYYDNPLGELGGLANRDHYSAGALVRDAVKLARLDKTVPDVPAHCIQKLYFFMVPRTVWCFLLVDVSDVMERTIEVIQAYKSQMQINFLGTDIQHILRTRRAAAGIQHGVKYAELFATDMPLRMTPQLFLDL